MSECRRRTELNFGIKIGQSTVADTLKDPIVVGRVYGYRTRKVSNPQGTREIRLPESEWKLVYEDPGLAIITEEQFSALKLKFQRNQENSRRNIKNWYPPIRGMVFCSSCGRKMSGQYRGGRQPGFRCIPCRRWVKAVPLWDEIRVKVREIILQPELLAAALKSRLDNGEAIDRLDMEIKEIRSKLTTLDRAEQKALRLHLYVDSEGQEAISEGILLAEEANIRAQRKDLRQRELDLQHQMEGLQNARVDEEGIRRFLAVASQNLESWDEIRWGVLLEALRLKVLAYDDRIDVEIAVPSVEDNGGVTMNSTSPCGPRPTKTTIPTTGNTEVPGEQATASTEAGPSPATFPMSRWGGSSSPLFSPNPIWTRCWWRFNWATT